MNCPNCPAFMEHGEAGWKCPGCGAELGSIDDRLKRPHRDRRWPRGETPSLFEDVDDTCTCGYAPDSFACKIRHLQMNTGAAKAARD